LPCLTPSLSLSLSHPLSLSQTAKHPTDALCRRSSCIDLLNRWRAGVAGEGGAGEAALTLFAEDPVEEDRSLQFVNEWLTTVTDHAVGLFLAQAVKLSALSAKGCFQLSADIGYLVNVSSALGIPPHPLLLHFRDLFAEGKAGAVSLLRLERRPAAGLGSVLRDLHQKLLSMLSDGGGKKGSA
jgi:hypothetical protein